MGDTCETVQNLTIPADGAHPPAPRSSAERRMNMREDPNSTFASSADSDAA